MRRQGNSCWDLAILVTLVGITELVMLATIFQYLAHQSAVGLDQLKKTIRYFTHFVTGDSDASIELLAMGTLMI